MLVVLLISAAILVMGEAQSAPRCPVGYPLPNIFCGRGPNRQDCPRGYYCEIEQGDRFAICCPNRSYRNGY